MFWKYSSVPSVRCRLSSSIRQIFPPDVLESLKIRVINFNPVTSINMVKTLNNLAVIQSQSGIRKFQVPDKTTLENLAESVREDLRAGNNALQFSCLNDNKDLREAFEGVSKVASSKAGKFGKKDKKTESKLSKIGGKDLIFHTLGKILYAKRKMRWSQYSCPSI